MKNFTRHFERIATGIALGSALFLSISLAHGQNKWYSQSDGTVNTAARWNSLPGGGGSTPTLPGDFQAGTDTLVIQDGHDIRADLDLNIASMVIDSGGTNTFFRCGNNGTARSHVINGDVTVGNSTFSDFREGSSNAIHTVTIVEGSIIVNGNGAFDVYNNNNRHCDLVMQTSTFALINSATVNIDVGDMTVTGGGTVNNNSNRVFVRNLFTLTGNTTFLMNDDMRFRGGVTVDAGSIMTGTGGVQYFETNSQTLQFDATPQFDRMEMSTSGTTITVNGEFVANDQLRLRNGVTLTGTGTFKFNDELRIDNGSTFDLNGIIEFTGLSGASNLTSNNAATQTITADILCTGNTVINGGYNFLVDGNVRLSSGYLNIQNNASLHHVAGANTDTLEIQSGLNLYLRGTDNFPNDFNVVDLASDSWARYDQNIDQTVESGVVYGNLQFSGNGNNDKTPDGDLDINGRFHINGGEDAEIGTNNVNFAGADVYGDGDINMTAFGGGTFTFDGDDLTQFIDNGSGVFTFENLVFDNMSPTAVRTRNIDRAITVNGNLTVQNTGGSAAQILVVDVDANAITAGGIGTFTLNDHCRWYTSGATNFGDFTSLMLGGVNMDTLSYVRFDGGVDQTIPAQTYGSLYIQGNSVKTLAGSIDIKGDFGRSNGTPLLNDAGNTIDCSGNWDLGTNGKAYTPVLTMTGTVNFEGADQVIEESNFNHVIFAGTGIKSINLDNINVDGNLTVNSGVTVNSDRRWDVAGDITVLGTGVVNITANTMYLDGAADQDINIATPATSTFNAVVISNVGGDVIAQTDFYTGDDLEVLSGGSLDLNGSTAFIGGDWEFRSGASFTHTNGRLHLNGTTQQNFETEEVTTYYDIYFSGAGPKEFFDQDIDVDGDFSLTGCSVDQNGIRIHLAGDWLNSGGTFTGNDSVVFDGNSPQNIQGSSFFRVGIDGTGTKTLTGNIILTGGLAIENGATLDAGADFSISVEERFEHNNGGTFNANNGAVVFTGSANGLYSGGIGAGNSFWDVTVQKTPATTLDINSNNIEINGDLTIISGELETNARDVNIAGSLIVSGGVYDCNNNNSVLTFDGSSGTHTFTPGSSSNYRDIVFNASGATYNLGGDLAVVTDRMLTVTDGTVDMNSYDITLDGTGDLAVNGGSFEVDSLAILTLDDDGSITVGAATFRAVGTAGGGATIQASSGDFTFAQNNAGGTTHASYATFIGLGGNGLDFTLGSVDGTNNFNNCTFNGGTGTAYMTIAAAVSFGGGATIQNTAFNDNAGNPTFNCSHTAGDVLTFEQSTGTRSGVAYENDDAGAATGSVRWTYPGGKLWIGAGDGTSWNDAANWAGGTPIAGENVILDHSTVGTTYTVNLAGTDGLSANMTIDNGGGAAINLTLNGGELHSSGDITIGSGNTLTQTNVGDTIFVQGNWSNAGTFVENTSWVVFNDTTGTQVITPGATDPFHNIKIDAQGTLGANFSTISLGSALDVNGTFQMEGGVLELGFDVTAAGDWLINGGTIDPGNNVVTFDQQATATQSINGGTYYDVVFVNGGAGTNTKQLESAILVENDLLISTASILDAQTFNVFVGGDWTNNASALGFSQTGIGTVFFNGDGDQSISSGTFKTPFHNVNVQGSGGIKTIGQDMDIGGNLTLQPDPDPNGRIHITSGVTVDGVGGSNTLEHTVGILRIVGAADFPTNFESVSLTGGTVQYWANIDQSISAQAYNIVSFATASGNGNNGEAANRKTALGDIHVAELMQLTDADDNVTLDMDGHDLYITGVGTATSWDMENGGPQVDWGGVCGAGGTFIQDGDYWNADADITTFANVRMEGSGNKFTNSNWTVNGNFEVRDGVNFDQNTFFVDGAGCGTSIFTVTAGSRVTSNVIAAGNGVAFPRNFNSYALDATSLTYLNSNSAQTIFTNGGTLIYGDLDITGDGDKTLDGNLDVDGEFDQQNNNCVLIDGGFDMNFAGDVDIRQYTATAGVTMTFDGDDQTIFDGQNNTFHAHHVIAAGTGTKNWSNGVWDVDGDLTVNNNVTVTNNRTTSYAGQFTNDGTYTSTANCHTFDGAVAQTIDPGSHNFDCVIFDNGSPLIKTIVNTGLDVDDGNFIVEADALVDMGELSHTIETQNFTIDGTWGTDSCNISFDRTGGTQNIPAMTLDDVTFATSGTKRLQGVLTCENLTIEPTVTFDINDASDFDINCYGNWTNNGTFQDRDGTVYFESVISATKTITTNDDPFYNLQFHNSDQAASTYMMQDDLTTNEDITIDNGATLDANGNILTCGNNDGGNPAGEIFTVMSGAVLEIDSAATLQFNGNDNGADPRLTVDAGGTLRMVGASTSYATLTLEGGTNIYINVDIAGTIAARYYSFNYLNTDGLDIQSTATIHSSNNLSDGSFNNMPTGPATYITLEANVIGLADIANVAFNHSSPVVGTEYNVTRTVAPAQGTVTFVDDVTGLLGGATYEDDANDIVDWPPVSQTTWTGNANTTNWFTAGNWSDGVPTASVDAIIPLEGFNPIIDAVGAVARTVTITDGFLRMNSGFDLDIESDMYIGTTGNGVLAILDPGCQINVAGGWTIGNTGLFSAGGGTVEFDGGSNVSIDIDVTSTADLSAGTNNFHDAIFSGGGTYSITNDIGFTGDVTISSGTVTPTQNNYEFWVAGNVNGTGGTFSTITAGDFVLTGAAQTITAMEVYDLEIDSAGTKTTAGVVSVARELNVYTGATLSAGAGSSWDIEGNVDFQAGSTFDDGGQSHTFAGQYWYGDGAKTDNASGTVTFDRSGGTQFLETSKFNNITFTGASQMNLNGDVDVTEDVYIANTINTFRCDTFLMSGDGGGTLTLEALETIYVLGADNFPSGFSTYALNASSITRYEGVIDQAIRGVTYGDLTLVNATNKTLSGNIDVNGDIRFNTATLTAANNDINIAMNWINNNTGSFIAGTGTVTFDGSTAGFQNIYAGDTANGTKNFYEVRIDNSVATSVRTLTDLPFIDEDLRIDNGTFTTNGLQLEVGGFLICAIGAGTIAQSGTIVMTQNTGTCNIRSNESVFNNLTLDSRGAGTAFFKALDEMTVANDYILNSGTFNSNAQTINLGTFQDVITISGDYLVTAGGKMQLCNECNVDVEAGGTFTAVGSSGNFAAISRQTTGRYSFNIDGTLKAQYYAFSYMGLGGIVVNSTATIDAANNLSDGIFTDPAPGGYCLRVENTQNLTGTDSIANVSFPVNPGSGGLNVVKLSAASGTLEFYNAVGEFSGEDYDGDPTDLIDWTGPVFLTWNGSVSTDWYNSDNWTASNSQDIIPDTTIDATVPLVARQPTIATLGAKVSTLTMDNGSVLTLGTGTDTSPDLTIDGDLNLDGTMTFTSDNDKVRVRGNWTRSGTGNLDAVNKGKVEFANSTGAATLNNGTQAFNEIEINASGDIDLGSELVTTGDIVINAGNMDITTGNYDITCGGNWTNTGGTFNAESGRVLFNSGSGNTIQTGGSNFYDVTFDGAGVFDVQTSSIVIEHNVDIDGGTLSASVVNLRFGTNSIVSTVSVTSGGTLTVNPNTSLELGRDAIVNIENGGIFRAVGTDASNISTVTRRSQGNYYFNVLSGGTIHAIYFLMEYMQNTGIYVQSGGLIDATNNFSFGEFRNGIATGQYLRIESTQDLSGSNQIIYTNFSDLDAGIRNCAKTVETSGNIDFYWAYGSGAGEDNENDPSDIISWDQTLEWVGGVSSSWNDPDNWDNNIVAVTNIFVPTTNTFVLIPTAGVTNEPDLDVTTGYANDLEIETGRTLDILNGTALVVNDSVRLLTGSTLNAGSSTLSVGGAWTAANGTFSEGTSTVSFTTDDTVAIDHGTNDFCGLDVNSSDPATGLVRTGAALDVNCAFTITAGTFEVADAGHTINVEGDWTNSNGVARIGFNGGAGEVIFDGTGIQNITHGGGSEQFNNVRVSNTGPLLRLQDHLDVNDLQIDDASTFSANNFNVAISGDWDNQNTVADAGYTTGSGFVTFDGGATQNIDHAGGAQNFAYITLSGAGTDVQSNIHIDMSRGMQIGNNSALDMNGNNINLRFDWTNNNSVASAGFTSGGGTVTFDGNIDQTISHSGGTESFHHLTTSNTAGSLVFGDNVSVAGNLVIGNACDINTGGNNFNVGGNWTNANSIFGNGFAQGAGLVTFDGAAQQTFNKAGTAGQRLIDVTIANTFNGGSSILLNDHMFVLGTLTLTDGIIETGGNRVECQSTAAADITGHSSASFINGNLRKYTTANTDTYAFPVGSGNTTGDYFLGELVNASMDLAGATDYLDVSNAPITEGGALVDGNITTYEGAFYDDVKEEGVWTIEPSGAVSSGSYGVRLYIANMAGLQDDKFGVLKAPTGITDYNQWDAFSATTTIPSSGGAGRTLAGGFAEKLGFTSFSLLAVGGAPVPLPIDLLEFDAQLVDDEVHIHWVTATETNNDFFTVERSADGVSFEPIAVIVGAGNSSSALEYNFIDQDPLAGTSYYRLKQTDFNGDFEVFEITSINMNTTEVISVFPNPAQDKVIIQCHAEQTVSNDVLVYNSQGQLVQSFEMNEMEQTVEVGHLPSGVYTIIINGEDASSQYQLVIQK